MKAKLPKGVGGGPQNMNAMIRQAQKMQEDMEALQADLEACPDITLRSASVNAQGVEFLMYNFTDLNASGCMTFCEDSVINLLFIPQSDTENMLIAASTMESFCF